MEERMSAERARPRVVKQLFGKLSGCEPAPPPVLESWVS